MKVSPSCSVWKSADEPFFCAESCMEIQLQIDVLPSRADEHSTSPMRAGEQDNDP